MLCSGIFIIGAAVQTATNNVGCMIAGRIIAGFSVSQTLFLDLLSISHY